MADIKLGAPYFWSFPSFGLNFPVKASCTCPVSEGVSVPRVKLFTSVASLLRQFTFSHPPLVVLQPGVLTSAVGRECS